MNGEELYELYSELNSAECDAWHMIEPNEQEAWNMLADELRLKGLS